MPRAGASPLREALSRERRAISVALAASVAVAAATVALAGTSAELIVRSAQRPTILSLTFIMGVVQLLALGKAAGRYAERVSTHQGALRVMTRVRAETAQRLEPLVPAGLGARSADVVETVIGDVDRVQDLLVAVAGPVAANMIAAVCAVLVGAYIAPPTALVFALGIVLVGLVLPLTAARAGAGPQRDLAEARRDLRHVLDDAARSGDEYLGLGAGGVLARRLAAAEARYDRASGRVAWRGGLFALANVAVTGLTVVAVVANTQGALERGELGVAKLAVPALLAMSALELVSAASPALLGVTAGLGATRRLRALVARPWPVHDPAEPSPLPATSEVDLLDVDVLRDGERVLSGVSTAWGPGDVVAVRGPSGSGKTTLAHLVARFVEPGAGAARLGGVDYPRLTGTQVRTRVGYVSDDPHVFLTSLGANVRIARPEASDDEVLAALETAGLADLLATLPEGLATPLGGAATGLSGGERRRLGVARALLVDRPVLILDEPTEGLDEDDARAMLERVARLMRRGALIVISHRDDELAATRTLRVDRGRVTTEG